MMKGSPTESENVKPPLGLQPHSIWVEIRIFELMRAMIRYREAGKEIPNNWWKELNTHLNCSIFH